MPNTSALHGRPGSRVLLLCVATVAIAGCGRMAPVAPVGPVAGSLPLAPASDPGTFPGNLPLAPVSGGGTTFPGDGPLTRTEVGPTGGSNTPVTLSSTDAGRDTVPGGATNLPAAVSGQVDVRTGGQNVERQAYAWAAGAVQPRTNDPTVLRHEAVHWIDSELSRNVSWQNLDPKVSRAFYIWGTNKYYVVPNTGIRKVDVLPLVPTNLTGSHQNYFYNFDFGSRDGLHLLEDFCAEIGSGEKSSLLFDMLIFSAALGLKMEQANASSALYRGTLRAFMEMAAPGLEGRLQSFANDRGAKATALVGFLKRAYGEAWTRKVLGFNA